jgi:hypothetical protein
MISHSMIAAPSNGIGSLFWIGPAPAPMTSNALNVPRSKANPSIALEFPNSRSPGYVYSMVREYNVSPMY